MRLAQGGLMRISLTVAVLTLVGACGDDGGVQGGAFVDAGTMLDAGGRLDSGSMLDAGSDARVLGDAGFVPPVVPTQFTIKVGASGCFGDCPVYSVSVDLSGRVDFEGGLCTKRPGVFSKTVPRADVLAFYGLLNRSPYWTLPDRFLPNSPLCAHPMTDGSSSGWSASVDGHDKGFLYESGCDGPVTQQVAALEKELRIATGTEAWVSGGDFNCGSGYEYPLITEPSYRLSLGAQVVGLLKLDRSTHDWELTSCAGAHLAGGRVAAVEPRRWDLVDDAQIDLSAVDAGSFGSIVVDGFLDAGVTGIRGLREDEDVAFTITPASGC